MSNYNFLVLLELTLLPKENFLWNMKKKCFNPCFIGTYSITQEKFALDILLIMCFNPCFIGTYSITSR